MPHLYVSTRMLGLLILLGYILVLSAGPFTKYYDDFTTPQPWFHASAHVPDHEAGSNPEVEYNRTINRHVSGRWFVVVTRVDGGLRPFVCQGSESETYIPMGPAHRPTRLHDFIGNDTCPWRPGVEYEMCAVYELTDPLRRETRIFGPECTKFQTH